MDDSGITKRDVVKLISLMEGLQHKSNTFNGDKREIFDRLMGLESTVSNLSDSIKSFQRSMPCKDNMGILRLHEEKINKNTILIEKSKLSFLMSVLAIVVSLSTIVGGMFTVFSKVTP